jgi:nucleoside-diphosphate-sugar epimerase
MISKSEATLLTGASGYLGSLLVAALLAQTKKRLLLLVRAHHPRVAVLEPVLKELRAQGVPESAIDLTRVQLVTLPEAGRVSELAPLLRNRGVKEVLHCAGSVDYDNEANLNAANIELTRELLALAKLVGVERFVYVSTAFSSGYVLGRIPEARHREPQNVPTAYIRSKWRAEELVANASVPWVIVRPSIVIGDSRDGRYSGKNHGLYQLWAAAEHFFARDYLPSLHLVAPNHALPLLHQDAFVTGFMAVYDQVQPGSVVNLVSADKGLPTVRELYELWCARVSRPEQVYFHDRLEDVPRARLDRRQRSFLDYAATNIKISSHPWKHERGALDGLESRGLAFQNATLATVQVCFERFIAQSVRIRSFQSRLEQRSAPKGLRLVA